MANMKMVALIDAETRRVRELDAADVTRLATIMSDEIDSIEQRLVELRRDVDALKEREDGVP